MNYLSVCSGIEAASVAWHPLGWHPVAFSEIEPFPCAVLAHHFPQVPNLDDMTKFKEWNIADRIDLLVGGTPCQSFSVAGLRGGLADPRGNLMLTFGAIAAHFSPRWLLWENVPGVLSSNGGRDFGSFLGMLAELGYGFAYRVLDAQYFGVPQRRRRIFVVGYLGDWRRAATVLFERQSLRGDSAPRQKAGQEVARTLRGRANAIHREDNDNYVTAGDVCGSLCADSHPGSYSGQDAYTGRLIAHTLSARYDSSEDGCGRGVPLVAHAFTCEQEPKWEGGDTTAHTLGTYNWRKQAVQVQWSSGGGQVENDTAQAFRSGAEHNYQFVRDHSTVRRLTPRECERLQGFPDNWTLIPWRMYQEAKRRGVSYESILRERGKYLREPAGEECPDGPRYKAIGNSMAVPVMRWIGERIQMVDELITNTDGPVSSV